MTDWHDSIRWREVLAANQMGDPVLNLSVCIVTYERPTFLERCLRSCAGSLDPIQEVVVVDASAEDRGAEVNSLAEELGLSVRYVWTPGLAGWMTRSRNEALRWVEGDVIAFIDDDVVVSPEWARAMGDAFADPTVAAVGGRTRNNIPGEEDYPHPIGRYLPEGRLTDGFASCPDSPVEVDHGIGANMAFRRAILADLGGFRDDYPGTALREDTDMFLRVRAIHGRVLFVPEALVDHLPAPHVKGARFDTRYKLYGRRNHVVLLARYRGLGAPDLRRWIGGEARAVRTAAGLKAKVLKAGVTVAGVGWGLAAAARQASWGPTDPHRTDQAGEFIRARLGGSKC